MANVLELKARAKNLEPAVRIGKNGVNDNVVAEVEKLLKKRKLVKVKMLNNFPPESKDEAVSIIVEKTKSVLIDRVGGIFVIFRER